MMLASKLVLISSEKTMDNIPRVVERLPKGATTVDTSEAELWHIGPTTCTLAHMTYHSMSSQKYHFALLCLPLNPASSDDTKGN